MAATGLLWTLGLLAGAGGVYALYRMHAPNTLACPTADALDATLQRIRTGETTTATAEVMAQSYAGAGCADAAQAIRITIAAHNAYLAQATGRAVPDVFAIAPKEDLFDVYHLPNVPPDFLRDTVGTLLATPTDAWSDAELNVYAPQYSDKILAAFTAQGTYKPGVTPLAKLTVLNQLAAASAAALASRKARVSSDFAPDTEMAPADSGGGGGGGGSGVYGSGSASGSGSFSGSGGFHL